MTFEANFLRSGVGKPNKICAGFGWNNGYWFTAALKYSKCKFSQNFSEKQQRYQSKMPPEQSGAVGLLFTKPQDSLTPFTTPSNTVIPKFSKLP